MIKRVFLEEGEMVKALENGLVISCDFGPGGAWFDYDDEHEESLTEFQRFILNNHGILNENVAGAGI